MSLVAVFVAMAGALASASPASAYGTTLYADQGLGRGGSITSPDGRYSLRMQKDGNLVVYRNGVRACWARNTAGTNANYLVMQNDSNPVLYGNNSPWASNTTGAGDPRAPWDLRPRLEMQNDGNAVIYVGVLRTNYAAYPPHNYWQKQAPWATNTQGC